jgi:hypothetical protein
VHAEPGRPGSTQVQLNVVSGRVVFHPWFGCKTGSTTEVHSGAGPGRVSSPRPRARGCGFGSRGNDPSAGSPTETLLRLHLPLNGKV